LDIETIKLLRAASNMNQYELSEYIGVNRSELALVEAGYREPSGRLINAIRSNFDAEFIRLVEHISELGRSI